jgi:hypothetical protein
VVDGIQTVSQTTGPEDIATSFFIEAKDWKDSIVEAVELAKENGPICPKLRSV